MKSKEEIEKAIANLRVDLEHVSDWLNLAQNKYDSNRQIYKNVDRGEVLSASVSFWKIQEKIKLLEWVLEI